MAFKSGGGVSVTQKIGEGLQKSVVFTQRSSYYILIMHFEVKNETCTDELLTVSAITCI